MSISYSTEIDLNAFSGVFFQAVEILKGKIWFLIYCPDNSGILAVAFSFLATLSAAAYKKSSFKSLLDL